MPAEADISKPARPHRKLTYFVIAVATLVGFLAACSIWINRQILNTDNWTKSSAAMLQNNEVRTQLSGYLVDQIYANVDVAAQLEQALPPRLAPLAAPAASGLENAAEKAVYALLGRPRVQDAWESANRVAHTAFLDVIYDRGNNVSTANGVVTLDLRGLLIDAAHRVGLSGQLVSKLPPDAAQITVLKSDQLSTAQSIAKLLRHLPIVLTVLFFALLAAAVGLSRGWRRQALRATGWSLVFIGIAALATRALVEGGVVNSLVKADSVRPAVRAVWSIQTSQLVEVAVATLAYGIVIIAGAWLAGPTRIATSARRRLAPYLREPATAYGALALLVLLVAWWGPTPATRHIIPMLLLAALAAWGVHVLRRQTAREFPDVDREQVAVAGPAEPGSPPAGTDAGSSRVPAGPGSITGDAEERRLARLERLAQLKAAGVLDAEEFRAEKARVMEESKPEVPA